MEDKLKLYGFNNLTKALSFNIYDVCYAKTPREQRDYIAYIDEQYNSERLTNILTTLTDMIGATVLNIAKQDYILTPGRYVGIEEQEDDGEPFDEKMKRLTSELSEMFKKSHELENEIREKLGAIGYDI